MKHLSIYFKTVLIVCIGFLVAVSCDISAESKISVDDLQCRNLSNPDGVDFPQLSWKIKSSEIAVSQTAYEIEIASSKELLKKGEADVWKSGKQSSDKQFNIKPDFQYKEATPYYWRVKIWDNNDKPTNWSETAYFSIGLLNESSWSAKWVTYPYSKEKPLPYFRNEFQLDKKPVKALAYFCGLGAGELYVNGTQIDPSRMLNPAQTDYDHYALYSTLDVTEFVKDGKNGIGIMLGNGWFTQDRAWQGHPFQYGNPMFRLQLIVTFNDGSQSVINSNESWKWKDGPIYKTNIYFGEGYDARAEILKWSEAGITDADWQPVALATENMPPQLKPQLMEPIRKKEILSAKEIYQDTSGNWVFDFGVNVACIPLLEVKQPAGTQLTMRFAEEVDSVRNLDFVTSGWVHHGEIFKDEYICKGNETEKWSPKFTYHGGRFVELSGFQGKPDASTLKLIVVHTDLDNSGSFECADEQINKLHELAIRTVKGNVHGIPTDCPIREKCGWLGDTHAYVKMANLNFQMDNFWQKYLGDIRSGASKEEKNTLFHERYNNTFYFTDKAAGLPYMIAPGKRLCGVASPDWGTALVQLPWWMYVYYGNKDILEEYYPQMKQWTEHIAATAKDKERTKKYNANTSYIVYQGLGDWCPPQYKSGESTPVEFTSTAFHYLDTSIMEKVALLLGKEDDAKSFAFNKKEIAREMVEIMYDKTNKTFGSQTADALALDLGLVPEGDEKAVAESIIRDMNEKSEGFMDCGIFGIGRIGSMLARNGNAKGAWDIFTKKGENSFEWMWTSAKATTLWETLPVNGITQKSSWPASHNHPMQAGYDICFFEDIAGIRPDSDGYGFKVIRFEPLFCDYLPWAKANIETPYGEVSSSWKKNEANFEWKISIPANSSGIVIIPFGKEITVNGQALQDCTFLQSETSNNATAYKFPSGEFKIKSSI